MDHVPTKQCPTVSGIYLYFMIIYVTILYLKFSYYIVDFYIYEHRLTLVMGTTVINSPLIVPTVLRCGLRTGVAGGS